MLVERISQKLEVSPAPIFVFTRVRYVVSAFPDLVQPVVRYSHDPQASCRLEKLGLGKKIRKED